MAATHTLHDPHARPWTPAEDAAQRDILTAITLGGDVLRRQAELVAALPLDPRVREEVMAHLEGAARRSRVAADRLLYRPAGPAGAYEGLAAAVRAAG